MAAKRGGRKVSTNNFVQKEAENDHHRKQKLLDTGVSILCLIMKIVPIILLIYLLGLSYHYIKNQNWAPIETAVEDTIKMGGTFLLGLLAKYKIFPKQD